MTIPDKLVTAAAEALSVGEWAFEGQPVRRDEIAHAVLVAAFAALPECEVQIADAASELHALECGCDGEADVGHVLAALARMGES